MFGRPSYYITKGTENYRSVYRPFKNVRNISMAQSERRLKDVGLRNVLTPCTTPRYRPTTIPHPGH